MLQDGLSPACPLPEPLVNEERTDDPPIRIEDAGEVSTLVVKYVTECCEGAHDAPCPCPRPPHITIATSAGRSGFCTQRASQLSKYSNTQ